MAIKKTIAIVGATEKNGVEITHQFAQHDYRLLLISNDSTKLDLLTKALSEGNFKAEIESIACVKDGCWEADIIILAVPLCEEKEAAERMKEVATQKTVVLVSENTDELESLQHILPYSKLIRVSGDFQSKEITDEVQDGDADAEILNILQDAGFKISIDK
jgi:predicted dinucleotide-binding enzyme